MTFVFQQQLEVLHTAIAGDQIQRQIGGQAAQRKQQRLRGFDLETQLDLRLETIRRAVQCQRHVALTEQGIQMCQQLR